MPVSPRNLLLVHVDEGDIKITCTQGIAHGTTNASRTHDEDVRGRAI
jgi:hypothetical protein